jgi:uncharacterized protein (TIGR02266 family)
MHNARVEPRVLVDVPVAVMGLEHMGDEASNKASKARASDISETGLFLATDMPIRVGDTLAVRLELDGQQVLVPAAEVMWHRPAVTNGPIGAGLRFVAIDADVRQVLRRHVLQRTGPIDNPPPKRHRDLDDTLDLLPQLRASLIDNSGIDSNLSSPSRVFANIAATPRDVTMLPLTPANDLDGWNFRAMSPVEEGASLHSRATLIPTQLPRAATVLAPTIITTLPVRRRSPWQAIAVVAAGAVSAAMTVAVVQPWSSPPAAMTVAANRPVVVDVPVVAAVAVSPPPATPERIVVQEPVLIAEQPAKTVVPVAAVAPVVATKVPAAPKRELNMNLPHGAAISRTFVLHAPERVVVDLTGMSSQPIAPTEWPQTITSVRVGQPSPGVSRVVLGLDAPAKLASATLNNDQLRIRY